MSDVDRREAMAASLARAGLAHGLADESVALLGKAYEVGMKRRLGALDEHDPDYLHPGRSVLVLLQDVGPLPAVVLASAAVHESGEARFRCKVDEVREALGDEVAALVASIPLPEDEALAERLITLGEGACLVALAERLDHLRHAHLRHDPAWWRALDEEVRTAWGPVAERTHPRLADRYRAWRRAMTRRLGRQD